MTSDWTHFGTPEAFRVAVRWLPDPEPIGRRPAGHGWSMGEIEIIVSGQNVTESIVQVDRQSSVRWYLSPVLDWLATNWVDLLHEEHFSWHERSSMPAAVACRRALDYWGLTCDPKGRGTYQQVQAWYHRHALRSAALGAIVPDLFIRRCGDHVELSWTANPPPFSHEGLTFQSGAGHVRLPVANLAQPLWGVLQWVKESPPDLPEGYREDWATLCGKIDELEQLDAGAFHRAYVPHRVLQPAKDAFEQIQRLDLFVDRRSANELYVEEFSPAVAMFGGLSSALALLDIQRLRDALVAGFPGEDSVELSELVAAREGLPLGTPYLDGECFASDLLGDLEQPGGGDFVDVRAICARLEIAVEEIDFVANSIRGVALAGEGLSPKILVNLTHPYNGNDGGQRFTIGHELCHILFDRSRARRITHVSGSWAPPGIEKRANAFAAYLLMPRELIMRHFSFDTLIRADEIGRLAGILHVNESPLVEHLFNLDLIDEVERHRFRYPIARRH